MPKSQPKPTLDAESYQKLQEATDSYLNALAALVNKAQDIALNPPNIQQASGTFTTLDRIISAMSEASLRFIVASATWRQLAEKFIEDETHAQP